MAADLTQTDIQVRVRYKETDKMGVVHHSNYVNYYEVARTEMMRSLGLSYKEMEEKGIMLPVHHVSIDYISPAYYDDLLTIRIRLVGKPGVRLTFDHEIFNEAGTLINTGRVELIFVRADTRRPCRAPGWILEKFGF